MNFYASVVFVHVASLLLFFLAHGASMAVALRLRHERDEGRVRALLELSAWSLSPLAGVMLLVGFGAGILAGFLGNWWGRGWIWVSFVIFVVVGFLMYPLLARPLHRIRAAAGIAARRPFASSDPMPADAPDPDPAEFQRLLGEYDPRPVVALSVGAVLVITWLMLVKPF